MVIAFIAAEIWDPEFRLSILVASMIRHEFLFLCIMLSIPYSIHGYILSFSIYSSFRYKVYHKQLIYSIWPKYNYQGILFDVNAKY